jgi:hypothetical protein
MTVIIEYDQEVRQRQERNESLNKAVNDELLTVKSGISVFKMEDAALQHQHHELVMHVHALVDVFQDKIP